MKGCTVRMLIGMDCFPRHQKNGKMMAVQGGKLLEWTNTASHVRQAIQILELRFAFVGITEEWEYSVCLFHAMFGGSVHRREFLNVRPGVLPSRGKQYNATILKGFKDESDGELYARVIEIFWSNIRTFGVEREACQMSRESSSA